MTKTKRGETGNESGGAGATHPTEAGRYDWTTREGRFTLDGDVRRSLRKSVPLSRGTIADSLSVDAADERAIKAVSASLRRGVRDGWAWVTGDRGQARYSKAVTK